MFHFWLVSLLFSCPSLHEVKFAQTFSLISILFGGFLKQLPNRAHFEIHCTVVFAAHLQIFDAERTASAPARYSQHLNFKMDLIASICIGNEHTLVDISAY